MVMTQREKSLQVEVDGQWRAYTFTTDDVPPSRKVEWWRPVLVASLRRSYGPGILRQLSDGQFVWDRH